MPPTSILEPFHGLGSAGDWVMATLPDARQVILRHASLVQKHVQQETSCAGRHGVGLVGEGVTPRSLGHATRRCTTGIHRAATMTQRHLRDGRERPGEFDQQVVSGETARHRDTVPYPVSCAAAPSRGRHCQISSGSSSVRSGNRRGTGCKRTPIPRCQADAAWIGVLAVCKALGLLDPSLAHVLVVPG